MALQALSEYAIHTYNGILNMTITVASTNMDLQKTLNVNSSISDMVQVVQIPSLPTGLFVSAAGRGCALFQVSDAGT